jgi:hypothetical protein
VAEGLVASLARPGGNVTGLAALTGRQVEGKRLELLHAAVPTAMRVGVVLDSTSRLDPAPLWEAARALGLTLLFSAETASPDDFRSAFAAMVHNGADALYAPETPVNARRRDLIVALAVQHRLPAMYASRDFVEAGGLMAYGPSFAELLRIRGHTIGRPPRHQRRAGGRGIRGQARSLLPEAARPGGEGQHQLGRRNMTPGAKSYLREKRYNLG